jgi:3-oxoacyl-[acyl-carrier protein] reductase
MAEKKWGRIINITGHASIRGSPHSAHVVAGKGAVIALTRGLATEFASRGITVNNVAPGRTENNLPRHRYYRDFSEQVQQEWNQQWEERIPMGRGATLKEFASLVVYLATDDAAYLTGQTYLVNGGMMFSGA